MLAVNSKVRQLFVNNYLESRKINTVIDTLNRLNAAAVNKATP